MGCCNAIKAPWNFYTGIINYLVEYPNEQEKLYSKMIEVSELSRHPSSGDRTVFLTLKHSSVNTLRTSFAFFPSLECTIKFYT